MTDVSPSTTAEGDGRRHVLYPNRYVWYILGATLDIIMTNTVIFHFGAREVNTIADALISLFGLPGLIALKFVSVIIVVLICETVGRHRRQLGGRVADIAIVLSFLPVAITILQLSVVMLVGQMPPSPDELLAP